MVCARLWAAFFVGAQLTVSLIGCGGDVTGTSNGVDTLLAGFFVTPNGSPSGDGSDSLPWDLATALAHPPQVQPGDVIWLRGGTYQGDFVCELSGTPTEPIVVRGFPNERATVDGTIQVPTTSNDTYFWGFEITSSAVPAENKIALDVRGAGTKIINMVIHDAGNNNVGFWIQAVDGEMHGSIIYNSGRTGSGHGVYTQNDVGLKRITDNIFFHALSGFDIHTFGTNAVLRNYEFVGNVGINNGHFGDSWIFRTGTELAMENVLFDSNMVYGKLSGFPGFISLGPNGPGAGDLRFVNNYLRGGIAKWNHWDRLTVTGNTFIVGAIHLFVPADAFLTAPAYLWDNNAWVVPNDGISPGWHMWLNGTKEPQIQGDFVGWQTATGYDANSSFTVTTNGRPASNAVFVRENEYEQGRANIVIFNWEGLASVQVDVSNVVASGAGYEIRHVFDLFGSPVASGIYSGGSISVPMTAVAPPEPVGGWPGARGPPPTPGPEFGAFVLVSLPPQ